MSAMHEETGETGEAIGVVVVTYGSDDVIDECLDGLFASEGARLRVVVADNASPDDTLARVRAWAAGRGIAFAERETGGQGDVPDVPLLLLRSSRNLGFGGGVNLGLEALLADPRIGLFWLVNPDCVVTPGAAAAYLRAARRAGPFGLMGGRTVYREPPNHIQSDGGLVNLWTGVCHNVNRGRLPAEAEVPDPATLDFIVGANVVVSRAFIERAGLMPEDYFLYFEEVDWALRRGDLPLVVCPEALVHHQGGTAIGTGSVTRRPSAFANYFNYRSRMRFVRRYRWPALPVAYGYALAKAAQLALRGAWDEAGGIVRALNGLAPPAEVRVRLSPEAGARVLRRKPAGASPAPAPGKSDGKYRG